MNKTNAQKCIEANAKTYKRKPVFKRARQVKRMMKEMDRKWSNWQKDIEEILS